MFGVIAPYMVLAVPIPGARLKFFTLRRWLAQLAGYFKKLSSRSIINLIPVPMFGVIAPLLVLAILIPGTFPVLV